MSEFNYQIGEICKAVTSKKMYGNDVENAKKDTHLFLDFYRDFVGSWFDATEKINFPVQILDDQKQSVEDWQKLSEELPKRLSDDVTFTVDLLSYMATEITLGALIENVKHSLEISAVEASAGQVEIDHVYNKLQKLSQEDGFDKDTVLKFNHHVVVKFDAQFTHNKYAQLLNQARNPAMLQSREMVAEQAEQDLVAHNRAQIHASSHGPITLKRRNPKP